MNIFKLVLSKTKKIISKKEKNNQDIIPDWYQIKAGQNQGKKIFISNKYLSMVDGTYDSFIFEAFFKYDIDFTGYIVWDVGAHIGYYSLAFSEMVGSNGNVLAFEPNPYNLERLKINIHANSLDDRIQISNCALSNSNAELNFRINKNVDNRRSSGSYLDFGEPPSDRFPAKTYENFINIRVNAFTPDKYISYYDESSPDLIKLDIEGSEVRFLEGAVELLKNKKPKLLIEVHNIQNMYHVMQILHKENYQLFLLDDPEKSSSRCFLLAK